MRPIKAPEPYQQNGGGQSIKHIKITIGKSQQWNKAHQESQFTRRRPFILLACFV